MVVLLVGVCGGWYLETSAFDCIFSRIRRSLVEVIGAAVKDLALLIHEVRRFRKETLIFIYLLKFSIKYVVYEL